MPFNTVFGLWYLVLAVIFLCSGDFTLVLLLVLFAVAFLKVEKGHQKVMRGDEGETFGDQHTYMPPWKPRK